MIDKSNFKDLLRYLNFEEKGAIFQKKFEKNEAYLKVDFNTKKLIYPEDKGLKVTSTQTCNFHQKENFVVFECVHRLLEKGYEPKHIELEPKWKLGRGASGGRADILVNNQQDKPLLLIECKTEGREFKKAWDETLDSGGQLFSYVQQIAATEFLCLYASDFDKKNQTLTTYQRIISHKDNEDILKQHSGDKPLKSFKEASNVIQRYQVWKNTYQLEYTETGIFEDNIQTYSIGKENYTLKDDTNPVTAKDIRGKYHRFRTILRKHNIARKETAFEVLVNLFLCKIVDEQENPNNLKLYWKGIAYDNYFDFVDRLQELYQIGMDQFLDEKITYISNEQISDAFWTVKNDKNATKQLIQKYFRELKFFSNNAFSLINVHNERLFNKNVKVLVELVGLWQKLRLKTEKQNQFLGDMFEYFLDNSIKQSEGQFFTPMPICKFIVSALPLEDRIANTKNTLRTIDYACGSGHFLNEYAHQIKPFVEQHKQVAVSEYYKTIIGVEKEDRLAKVAKVSAFMYGQGEIQIIDRDALNDNEALEPESFDVLVANPPFAVEGFLKTLKENIQEKYTLTQTTGFNSNTKHIQCFFIERAKQLLKPSGIAGIIVPSSILSKENEELYTSTREIILKYFDIVSLVELGSSTFGKTGTNTVVLFLRRKEQQPEPAEHYRNRVTTFFDGIATDDDGLAVYDDLYLVKKYCEHIEVKFEDYLNLLNVNLTGFENLQGLMTYDIFKDYKTDFDKSTTIKNLKKSRTFKAKDKQIQQQELNKLFIEHLQEMEKDKLYYFILAYTNPQKVLIVKSPTKNADQKKFLGYEWSGSKGNEGIKYYGGETVHNIITPMFDPKNTNNPKKINYVIQQNFLGNPIAELPENCSYANVTDILDFSRKDFNKAFSLTPKKSIVIDTKWDLVKIGDLAKTSSGGTPLSSELKYYEDGKILWVNSGEVREGVILDTENKITKLGLKNSSAKIFPPMTVLIAMYGATAGQVGILGVEASTNQAVCGVFPNENYNSKYLFYYLSTQLNNFLSLRAGTARLNLNQNTIQNFKIPLPPLNIQQQIVQECEAIDKAVAEAQTTVKEVKLEIEEKVKVVYDNSTGFIEIRKISNTIQYGLNEKMNTIGKGFKIFRMNEIIDGKMFDNGNMKYADISVEEFEKYKLKKGDILFNRTNSIIHVGKTGIFDLEGEYCFASYLIRVIVKQEVVEPYFVNLMMNSTIFQKEAKSKASKAINQANINATIMGNIKIPVPPITEQQTLITEITTLENKITAAEVVINAASTKKQAVMDKYL